MKRPLKLRPFVALAVAAAVSFGTSACSSVERDAARVGAERITIAELEAITEELTQQNLAQEGGATDGSLGALPASNLQGVLTALVAWKVEKAYLAAQNSAITAAQLSAALQEAKDAAPKGESDRLTKLKAELRAVNVAVQARDPEAVRAAFANADVWINPAYGRFDLTAGVVALSDSPAGPELGG